MTRPPRTAAAVAARQHHAEMLLERIRSTVQRMGRDGSKITVRSVATRAQVSRTFLYENADARHIVSAAVAGALDQALPDESETDQREASWRERALNAEAALTEANNEIQQQRQRIGVLMGQMRDLEQTWSHDGVQRLSSENTSLKLRVRQLGEQNHTLDEGSRSHDPTPGSSTAASPTLRCSFSTNPQTSSATGVATPAGAATRG